MQNTTIEWTDRTWNPTKGCSKVSDGCKNCYAMRMAARLEAMGQVHYQGLTGKSRGKLAWTGRVNTDEKALHAPLSWKKPSKIFVNSMSDLFHEGIEIDFLKRIWAVMSISPQHQYQVLTKRPERMLEVLKNADDFPLLSNVWLGVSVENQKQISRLDILRDVPAHVRFVSFEPLLGPISGCSLDQIDWAIVGGESGPRSRPVKEDWILDIQESCRKANTAFFFKQWGGVNKKQTGRKLNNQEFNAFPEMR